MDWNVIQQYLPLYQKAAVLTVRLGVAGIFFAILIGLVCAVIQYEKVPGTTPRWKAGACFCCFPCGV